MPKSKKVTFAGAGAVGTVAALILAKLSEKYDLGYEITLAEFNDDILDGGAAATTNILHIDGFEYHKPFHSQTGKDCIDGGITKGLMFDARHYLTHVCTEEWPIRFMVSYDSLGVDGLTVESFIDNAENMGGHFASRFNRLVEARGSRSKIERMLGRNPETFARLLDPSEYSDCANIVCGYAGAGAGVNMPQYYALLKASLRASNIDVKCNVYIESLLKQPDNTYKITNYKRGTATQLEDIVADHISITAGHHAPQLTARIGYSDRNLNRSDLIREDGITCAPGTYYLNAMLYAKLPATTDKKILDAMRVNFVLQAEGGCMFSCIAKPTKKRDGLAAIYYPSEKGSQLDKHLYTNDRPEGHPRDPNYLKWDEDIIRGLQADDPRVKKILKQSYRYYPFLENYAKFDKALCRTVFNADVPDSDCGLDRRVRGLKPPTIVTTDGQVAAHWSPKWTTSELAAFGLVDQILQKFNDKKLPELPKNIEHGFGPTFIDVEQISRDIHFRDVKMDVKDTITYVVKRGGPEQLISPNTPDFIDGAAYKMMLEKVKNELSRSGGIDRRY